MPYVGGVATTVPIALKTVTFTGAAGAGAVGSVALYTVTGRVRINSISAYCSTLLTEALATSTIVCGTTSQTTRFIANPTGGVTDIDAGEWWTGTTPTAGSIDMTSGSAGATDQVAVLVSENIILTIGGQACNAGVLEFHVDWTPLSAGASVVAA